MADIFISYAQKAAEPTQTLAAELAALKYSVWFDQRLLPVDTFIEVINHELDSAKAVITIWSNPALESRWVKAEAARAERKSKLINVHTPDVHPEDLPVPFNISNVTPIANRTKIYEALATLGVHPGGVAPAEKAAREASEAALAFEHIKASTDIEDFEAFLADFGADGKQFYIRLAKKRIAELSAGRSDIVVAKPVEIAEMPLPQAGDVFLRIEPGMHTATIRRIGVNAACTLMVTAADDKTARLWALPEGGRGSPKLLRTLRVPIGEGNDGKINAVALSPDGKWVAAGGWDVGYFGQRGGFSGIYIFEAESGKLVTRLGPFGTVIGHLAFAPDGRRLAATLAWGEGMRLWETGSWRQLAEDKEYGGEDSFGAAFGPDGGLYTVAFGGAIRRYGADGALETKATTHGGTEPYSIAVHPDGMKLAVGFNDTAAVEVYDARTLQWLYAASASGIGGDHRVAVAWSADGARLYGGGNHTKVSLKLLHAVGLNPTGQFQRLSIWQEEGRGRRSEAPLSESTIMQLLPCGDGMAAGTADPAFGMVAADGTKRVWQDSVTADVRDVGSEFGASVDGSQVRFGLRPFGKEPLLFDLAAFGLHDAPQAVPGLAAPRTRGIAVKDWENSDFPKLNSKPIALEARERSRALAIAPDASRFALGTEWTLRVYRADGGELWQKSVPGTAWGVNISGNGKLVAAAYADGTIRWHRLSDGQELLALFVHAKDRRFIAWTPQGYYNASPGGEDLIGWHVNRGYGTAPDFYPASTFASTFRRPDIVRAALDV
ncbi:MAG: toll/interleukin-1 receptor domain-containing protein [Rhodomicrobium sp.]